VRHERAVVLRIRSLSTRRKSEWYHAPGCLQPLLLLWQRFVSGGVVVVVAVVMMPEYPHEMMVWLVFL